MSFQATRLKKFPNRSGFLSLSLELTSAVLLVDVYWTNTRIVKKPRQFEACVDVPIFHKYK
jgi:hypothetical protein